MRRLTEVVSTSRNPIRDVTFCLELPIDMFGCESEEWLDAVSKECAVAAANTEGICCQFFDTS